MTDEQPTQSVPDEQPTRVMADEQPGAARGGATRRGFLALAGITALAGCNGVGGVGDVLGGEPPKIDGGELNDALSAAPPTVPETVPISIEESHLDETVAAVEQRLTSVPAPFDAQAIPNGAIRERLSEMHADATTALEEAAGAPSSVETMASLRDTRERTGAVVAAWEAIDDGLSFDDLRQSVPQIRKHIDTFRSRWRYVGDDPVRSVLAHGQIEELVAFAGHRVRDSIERYSREPENPIQVGEFAGDLEETKAALADAEYLYDRYESSLDDIRRVRSGITAAGDSLVQTLEDRRTSLPTGDHEKPSSFVDRDIEETPIAFAMTELYEEQDYAAGLTDELATGQRARAILSTHETLVRVRAFESLRERVNDGEYVTVESASDVRKIRESAINAFESTLASNENQRLNRYVLSQIDGVFEYTDRELGNYDEDDKISVKWLERDVGQYVLLEAVAKATPPASADVADEIRRAF